MRSQQLFRLIFWLFWPVLAGDTIVELAGRHPDWEALIWMWIAGWMCVMAQAYRYEAQQWHTRWNEQAAKALPAKGSRGRRD